MKTGVGAQEFYGIRPLRKGEGERGARQSREKGRRIERERERERDGRAEMAERRISAQGETQEQESEKESEGCMNKQWLWIGFSCMRGRCTNKGDNIGL